MRLSDNGLRFIAKNEAADGPKLKAYLDTGGVLTIGYGHTRGVYAGQTCTPGEALAWLLEDTQDAETAVSNLVAVAITQNEYDALVDFVFNVGSTALTKSTLLKLLNQDQHEMAALEFRKWRFDNGQEIAGLLARRVREKDLFLTPV